MAGELTGYLAPEDHLEDLLAELGDAAEVHGRLVLAPGPPRPASWVANIWREPERLAIASIADGARQLRARQRNWALYPHVLHRRAGLIAERLPHVGAKPLVFPAPAPRAPLGSWMLLDGDTILAAADCSSPFPNGEARFVEDRARPAQPRLSQALGGADLDRSAPGARRALPRPRRQPRRLELGAGQAGRPGHRRRQGAPRSRGGGAARRREFARPAPSPSSPPRSGRWTGSSAMSSAIPRGCWRWSSAGLPRGWCATSSARSNSRARRIWRRRGASPRSRARASSISTTTSMS